VYPKRKLNDSPSKGDYIRRINCFHGKGKEGKGEREDPLMKGKREERRNLKKRRSPLLSPDSALLSE